MTDAESPIEEGEVATGEVEARERPPVQAFDPFFGPRFREDERESTTDFDDRLWEQAA
jgi:hypothetical protein